MVPKSCNSLIYSQFMKFLTYYLSIPSVLPQRDNENDFAVIRNQLLNIPPVSEQQIASRIAKTIHLNDKDTVDNPPIRRRIGKN
ncbi:unnamed protein product, partial [Rotaria sp. Silwood2]